MPVSDSSPDPTGTIRFKDVYGVFALGPDDVQFRTGSLSGPAIVVSDSERRGLLAAVIEKLLSSQGAPSRPWNEAEEELLGEVIPELRQNGIVEVAGRPAAPGGGPGSHAPMLRKPLAEARVAIVGHGVLGNAVRSLLADTPCGSIFGAVLGVPAGRRGFRTVTAASARQRAMDAIHRRSRLGHRGAGLL
jgi:hypothetical protein